MTRALRDAVIVGSGPNGLAAAVILARAGLDVQVLEEQPTPGGGCRTHPLTLPGAPTLPHDLCSAVHPMAATSPFFSAFDLDARGVHLLRPEISYAHPLDDHPAALAYTDLGRTIEYLRATSGGPDARAYEILMRPLVESFPTIAALCLSDMRSLPRPARTVTGLAAGAAFGRRVVEQGSPAWNRRFTAEVAAAQITGVSGHVSARLPSLAPSATMLLLGAAAHTVGWPIPEGGSQAITDALITDLADHDGDILCNHAVVDQRQLPPARVYLFDTSPWTLAHIYGARLGRRYRRALDRFPAGNGITKVDFILSGPVPWADPQIGGAGTVHCGGTRADMAAAEADITAGRHTPRPLVLVSQPSAIDPTRRRDDGIQALWTYTHVPAGSDRDMTDTITAQIERFAPGFRDTILASQCTTAHHLSDHNANYRGGDIAAGQVTMYRMIARPTPRWNPYRTPLDNVYLCSSSTPPGPSVHGMSGYHAAHHVLRRHFGIHTLPDLAPHHRPARNPL